MLILPLKEADPLRYTVFNDLEVAGLEAGHRPDGRVHD
jgi:hypothetical protein